MPCTASRFQMLRSRKSEKDIYPGKFRRSSSTSLGSDRRDSGSSDDENDLSEYVSGFYTRTLLTCGAVIFAIAAISELFFSRTTSPPGGEQNAKIVNTDTLWRRGGDYLSNDNECKIRIVQLSEFSSVPKTSTLIVRSDKMDMAVDRYKPYTLIQEHGQISGLNMEDQKQTISTFIERLLNSKTPMHLFIDGFTDDVISNEIQNNVKELQLQKDSQLYIGGTSSWRSWKTFDVPTVHVLLHGRQRVFTTTDSKAISNDDLIRWFEDIHSKQKDTGVVDSCVIDDVTNRILYLPAGTSIAVINTDDTVSLTFAIKGINNSI